MFRRLTALLAVGVLGAAVFAQGASADPTNAKNSFSVPANCEGQTVQFVVNGNGDYTPAHVVGSTAVFIPQSFDLRFEFTPTGGETESETFTGSKRNPHGDLVTCSIDATESADEGTFRAVGTVTGFFTPASGKSRRS